MAKIYILHYFRKGLSNHITAHGGLKQKRATLKVNLGVELNRKDLGIVEKQTLDGQVIQLMGPADVKSLQKSAVNRISPPEGAKTRLFKGYLPYVEFYEEDLPWRYTPVATGDKDFRPWMTLIAVKEDEVVYQMSSDGVKLATLQIGSEERYQEIFPNEGVLSKIAHVQIDSAVPVTPSNVNELLEVNPDCGISRILCTSVLEESNSYEVLLVPTFELGRLAGLGHSVTETLLGQCAWEKDWASQKNRPDGLTFPVYLKWKFKTSDVKADFKTLASHLFFTGDNEYDRMKAYLDVDISQSGLGDVHLDEEMVVDVPSALVLDNDNPSLREEDAVYTSALKELLELNPVLKENTIGEINMEEDPWIVPPVYGARHLLTTQAEFTQSGANVVKEVNLQLKNRIVAGLGSTVVKKNQEQFVNRAWKKVEKINQLNQAIREYYSMMQVEEKAQTRVRKSNFTVTDKNKALAMDVANRSLQTACIYRHHVSSDNLLVACKEMEAHTQQQQRVNCGITVNELKELFSAQVWEDIIKRDAIRELLTKPKLYDFFSIFEDYQVLNRLGFTVKKDDKDKLIFTLSGNSMELALPDATLLSFSYIKIWVNWLSLNQLSDESFTNLRNYVANKNPLFERCQSHCLDKYPLILEDGKGNVGVVVQHMKPFAGISQTKPVVVEYDKDQYYYVLPLDFVKSRKDLVYQLRITKNSIAGLEQDVNIVVTQNPQTGMFDANFALFDNFKLTKSANFKKLSTLRDKLAQTQPQCVVKNKKKKKYSLNFKHGISGELKEEGQSWLKLNDFYFYFNLNNSRYASIIEKITETVAIIDLKAMASVLTQVLDDAAKLDRLLFEPTHVVLPNLTPQSTELFKMSAEGVVATGKYDAEFYGASEWKVVANKLDRLNATLTDKLKMEMQPDEVYEEVETEKVHPTTLGEQRVDEILAKYGYTEDNQLKNNLESKYPVMAYPDFLDPTFFYLRECSVDYVVPSSGSLLKDSITYFQSNPQFEEAFLMGMNTEMGQELLWREYPTDQRGSYFRKFWDQETLPEKEQLDKYYDVKPLHHWKNMLGKNHMAGKNGMLVFVIRGELMQSYPNTSVYLAKNENNCLIKDCMPSMTSWLTDEICLVGFDNLQSDALDGYYLTFEQQPLSLQFERKKEKTSIADEFAVVTPQIYAIPLINRS